MQRLQNLDAGSGCRTRIIIGDAKSHTSNRVIPLNELATAICGQMRVDNANAYVMTGDPLRFMEPRTAQTRLAKYAAACDLKDMHFHALRHTFATRCVEVGFEIKSLSEILGHASAKITLDRYVHPSMELKRLNMDKLTAIGL